MGLVEKARQLAETPQSYEEYLLKQQEANRAVNSFMTGQIDGQQVADALLQLRLHEDAVYLDFPGPLYGLLRKLWLSEKAAGRLAEGERQHYRAAKQHCLNPRFGIEFSRQEEQNGATDFIHVFVLFDLPMVEDELARKQIYDVVTAPGDLSEDDLAKLPGYMI